MRSNLPFDTEKLRAQDRHWIHPWTNLKGTPGAQRTIIAAAEGVYFTDSDGNRLLDGPSGTWCVNIGTATPRWPRPSPRRSGA